MKRGDGGESIFGGDFEGYKLMMLYNKEYIAMSNIHGIITLQTKTSQ